MARLRGCSLAAAAWLAVLVGGEACGGDRSPTNGRPANGTGASAAAAAADTTPVLLAAGDIASCVTEADEATARLLDSLPGTVLALGDNVYRHGLMQEFQSCYGPSWGRHLGRTRATPGNHEYYVPGAADYFRYFGAAAGPAGKGYYSFDVGGWHVISLNSIRDTGADSPQLQWLRADLAAHPARCTLAFWHQPRFSSGGTHGSAARIGPLWEALYEANADVILQAHSHLYERLAPLAPDGRVDGERGIRSFVVGTGGGGDHHSFGAVVAGSEVRYGGGPGILKLTLGEDGYTWEFIATRGGVRDRGEGRCH